VTINCDQTFLKTLALKDGPLIYPEMNHQNPVFTPIKREIVFGEGITDLMVEA
jgi:hypothetical protein